MWRLAKAGPGKQPQALPLFPLRTVLFPRGLLPLKIFEQRYVEMAKDRLKNGQPFGVCLITQGDEVATSRGIAPEFATIGTLARITDFDMPQLGILHVMTRGETRFQVQSHALTSSGLVMGQVLPIADEPVLELPGQFAPLASLLELIAGRVGPQNFPTDTAYEDASWVGYRLAELLPLPMNIKQSMLEINDAAVRLEVLRKFLLQQGLIDPAPGTL